jgi:tetratricopeptide (TPR) repeat protein
VLLQLAVVSDRQNLELAPAFRQFARNAHGLTSDIALAQARALEAAGQADRGLQLLLDGSKGQEEMKPWRLAIAQYREGTKDPQVLVDWEALGQQYPNDLAVQTAITYAPSRVRDRQFWLDTIGRLKAITGEEGMEWRAERGRWLLAATEMSEKDKSEALKLLGEVASTATALPEPHRLLAKVLEKVPDLPHAIGEWQAAYNLRPDEPMYVTGLIQALMSAGRGAEALPFLDRLARNGRLDAETRHWTASQFASVGQTERAIELLKSEPPSRERDALLADFDRRLGRSAASLGPQARSNPG